jgi:hypothetical protein
MPYKDPEKRRAYQRERYYRKKREEQLSKLKEFKDGREREGEGFTEEEYQDLMNIVEDIKFTDFDIWHDVKAERDLPSSEKFKKKPYVLPDEYERELERVCEGV